MKRKWMLLMVAALGLALMPVGSALALTLDNAPGPDQTWDDMNLYCNGDPDCDFDDRNPDATYWHFVAVPNDTNADFTAFHLYLDNDGSLTLVDFDNSLILDGSGSDNVFVMVPVGYAWTDLVSGTADADNVSGDRPWGFNLSHVCVPTPEPSTLLLLGSALLGLGLTRRKVRV